MNFNQKKNYYFNELNFFLIKNELHNIKIKINFFDLIEKNIKYIINPENILIEKSKNNIEFEKNKNDEEDIKNNVENNKIEAEADEPLNSKPFSVIEHHFGDSGIKCDNFYIKNLSGGNVNFKKFLNEKIDLKPKTPDLPSVLIVHTHTTESYLQKEIKQLSSNFYPRSQDQNQTVVAVGEEIAKSCQKNGVKVIHDKTFHDFPNYRNAYRRSALSIKKNLIKNPSLRMIIDVHRDSMGNNSSGKIKPIFYDKKKKNAQIMIITGNDFKNWNKNLSLVLKVQQCCEKKFKGMMRPLMFSKTNYNQHLSPYSFLIEVGTDVNTIEEVKNTGRNFGTVISSLIKGE